MSSNVNRTSMILFGAHIDRCIVMTSNIIQLCINAYAFRFPVISTSIQCADDRKPKYVFRIVRPKPKCVCFVQYNRNTQFMKCFDCIDVLMTGNHNAYALTLWHCHVFKSVGPSKPQDVGAV